MLNLKQRIIPWDCNKDPNGYYRFITHFGSVVNTLEHGPLLEKFLDYKLRRSSARASQIPSFLSEDDDFSLHPPTHLSPAASVADHEDDEAAGDNDDAISQHTATDDIESRIQQSIASGETAKRRSSHYTVGGKNEPMLSAVPDGLAFHQLPHEAQELDKTLYNHLYTSITGNMKETVLTVQWPSYVQAVACLHKHFQCSQVALKTLAMKPFFAPHLLEYKNNCMEWKVKFMKAADDLYKAGVALEDIILLKAMHCFDGKNTYIKNKIAQDIHDIPAEEKGVRMASLVS